MKQIRMGKYTLVDLIAKGGMAEIHLAQNHMSGELKKLVAIKKVLPHFSNDADFVTMFKDEAKVLLKMNHRNIVSTTDFGSFQGQFFLVMEYIRGKNLRDLLIQLTRQGARIPLALTLFIAREIAQGLNYVHDFQDYLSNERFHVTHRDISPINIMIGYDGCIKIIDFGIAKSENRIEVTQGGVIKGKFGYMSPEQALGREVDHRTDIFSLGIVLWEMITHCRLIRENTEITTQKKYENFQAPTFEEMKLKIPFPIERLVRKCLEPEPQNRYANAGELLKEINLVINSLFAQISEQDMSTYIREIFAEDLEKNQKDHSTLLSQNAEFERTEVLPTKATSITRVNGYSILKFRNHLKIRWSGNGANL